MKITISAAMLTHWLRFLGFGIAILILVWNGTCDLIYGYSSTMDGLDYFDPGVVVPMVLSADGRPHWMVAAAESAGWWYPVFALTYIPWWLGTRQAGFWRGTVPILMLAYSLLMIGGIQHAGFSFLSALAQARGVASTADTQFFSLAERYIVEDFSTGDFTAAVALLLGSILLCITLLAGKTIFPRWLALLSPGGILLLTSIIGLPLPAPVAGIVLSPFGTWFMAIPCIAVCSWMLKNPEKVPREIVWKCPET